MKRLRLILYFSFFILYSSLTEAQYSIVHVFKDTGSVGNADGCYPSAGPLILNGKKIYGTSYEGGAFKIGCVFSLDTTGNNYKDLLDFNSINGKYPIGSIIMHGKSLYGAIYEGGLHDSGCVIRLDTDGNNYKDLLDFNRSNGMYPYSTTLVLSAKTLYGMTYEGGLHRKGCIFSIDTDGNSYEDLHDFDTSEGCSPGGSLSLSNGVLYGMTSSGNFTSKGVLFSIDTNGSYYKVLVNFTGTNGAYPQFEAPTVIGKRIYATTCYGGINGIGNFFSVDTDGNNFKELFDFTTLTGAEPAASLVLSGNKFYATACYGGTHGFGCIFSIDSDGSNYTDLFDFNSTNGRNPNGTLTLYRSALYGITQWGGPNAGDSGVIFKYVLDTETGGKQLAVSPEARVSVFPNPSTNSTTIQLNTSSTYYLELDDVTGRDVKHYVFIGKQYELNTEGLEKGMYFIRVFDKNVSRWLSGGIKKIVVE